MPRYIDVDLLMNDIEDLKKSPWYNDDFGNSAIRCARHEGVEIVVDLCIKRTPTADVQQIKHGRWIDDTKNLERVCSNCGREVVYRIIDGRWEYENYCPHCGAKMDGKEDEE